MMVERTTGQSQTVSLTDGVLHRYSKDDCTSEGCSVSRSQIFISYVHSYR